AHHPTAIKTTLAGLRANVGASSSTTRIIAVLEPRSNTMRLGIHKDTLGPSLAEADEVLLYSPPELNWDPTAVTQHLGDKAQTFTDVDAIAQYIADTAHAGDHVLIMSNGAFGGLHEKLLVCLKTNHA
ncbi:MAG: UDP-N-acetylmuramate:L-alanyl-gamma-D-glutamyl-meso-diaminopimelate ligase, partial [Porticoccus sp.]|nr:UDP-N-acetylmuramate:L-alanyl-gamma-D-glutamyl-meso-diaminopimelate ligase [Porticoccus sp.]